MNELTNRAVDGKGQWLRLRLPAVVVGFVMMLAACGGGSPVAQDAGNERGNQVDNTGSLPSVGDRSESSSAAETSETSEAGEDLDDDRARETEADDSNGPDHHADPGRQSADSSEAQGQAETPSGNSSVDPDPNTIALAFLFPAEEGDSGEAVQFLQSRLADLGFAPGTPDGSYGKRTARAVAAFQRLVGLAETGAADPETINALADYTYDGLVLTAGDEGPEVEELQERLAGGPFDPGAVDGEYGTATVQAVWALEKLADVPVDGNWGPLDEMAWEQLMDGSIGAPTEDHDRRWVEVDLTAQLAKVYDPGQSTPTLVSHVSSGSGVPWSNEDHSGSSITPTGQFEINRRISGWRESSLNIGRLYNPLYFNGGIAFHGATSVPLYPASHGCIRVPMHVAEYLPEVLPNGTPVLVAA